MRACILTTELGTVEWRRNRLLARLAELTGEKAFDDVSFVGCLQSQPVSDRIAAYQPYVLGSVKRRVAQRCLRFIDEHGWIPVAAARPVVASVASMLREVLLACDPDVILLDVRWGGAFRDVLEREFAGSVFVENESRKPDHRAQTAWRKYDSGAKVSIVLPTHNGSRYIRQSIESCLAQTHRNLELIVVDDGSTEDMGSIVRQFTDARVRYVRHERNRGVSAALNTGFTRAAGEYFTWTSDDNYYDATAIERLLSFLQTYPHVDFVYASSYIVDEMGLEKTFRVVHPQPKEHLQEENTVGACFLYTRRVYETIGIYNANAFLVEDYDYWLRVSQRFNMLRLFAPLYYYRFHKKALTFRHSRKEIARRFAVVKQQNGVA